MVHTFSVQFCFDNQEYTAMISQLQDTISVYIPDQSLHHILPLGRFYFKHDQHLNIEPSQRTTAENLMSNVQVAIELSGKIHAFCKQ